MKIVLDKFKKGDILSRWKDSTTFLFGGNMRDLLLMRGVPGSGKSTFIEQNHLGAYTICPDNIRLLFECPVVNPETGMTSISQKNDKKVWALVNNLVEEKMIRGEFIVIDAMNIDISSWKKLADKYRYRIWYKNFIDVPVDECIRRNNNREEYKRVPENVIRRAFNRIAENPIPKYAKEIDYHFFNGIQPLNVDNYENIYVFGDIHGCFDPLEQFFKGHPFAKTNLYVFCGDYLDRGPKNLETIEFLTRLVDERNVMFLEGNHNWEKYWANDEIDKIHSKEFLVNTVNQINGFDKSKVREWCRRWIQMAYLEFNGKKYFITHAGFGFFPGEQNMRFIPAHDMIRGGSYEDDVDAWYESKDTDVIQIHGHRNQYEYPVDKFTKTFNLNSGVEFGEPLRVMRISKSGYTFLHFENESCKGKVNPWKQNKTEMPEKGIETPVKRELSQDEQFVLGLRQSRDIIEKTLANGISSFNFKRDVFYSDRWNKLNKIARGLFVNLKTCKILARSYEKFFNYNEGDKNTPEFLAKNLKFPVTGYLKYNGFLGMMCYDHELNDLHFFSKSTDESDFAKWFKEIAVAQFNRVGTLNEIREYLKHNNVTMVFEVIDPENDPHIIEYQHKRVWLLDIVNNTIDFHKKSYDELFEIAKRFNMNVKRKLMVVNSADYLLDCLNDETKILSDLPEHIEGIVFEDANGYMFKYKMQYYLFWKKIRGVKQQIQKGMPYGVNKLNDKEKEVAEFMANRFTAEELARMSVIDVRNKYMEENK